MTNAEVPKVMLGELMATKFGSVDPSKFPDETFDLYSIPSFDRGASDLVEGSEIGSSKQVVLPGDVLLSKIVPHIRRAWIVGSDRGHRIIASGEWIVFRGVRIDPRYLRQVLVGDPFHAQFMNTVAGVGGSLVRARPSHVARIEIPLPPLAEQRRIAEVLDRAEALRAKRRAALAELDSLTQSLFLDLFGDPVTNPKGWPESGIEDVCELIVDCVNRTAPIVDGPTPFKMIRTTNVKAGKVNLAEVRYVTEETFKQWNRRTTPKRGDVLLTREAPVGEAGMLESDDSVFLGQRLMLYRTNRERMQPEYLLAAFRGSFLQQQFDRHGSGSTVKHLPLPACRSFQVHVPPIALQQEFARRVGAVEKLKAAQRTALAEQDALFATLQHRAFRGEL
jgi:type I restriction enzyme S subunit